MRIKIQPLLLSAAVIFLASCSSTKKITQATAEINSIHFLGKYEIPYNLNFQNTIVGGLSGIDYDKRNNLYYMICDDRSEKNPARFYTARISFTQKGIDSVEFIDVKNLFASDGNTYPNNKKDPSHTPDPEAMRYNAKKGQLIWSSEGERIIKAKDTVLADPSVNIISSKGKYIDHFPLPGNLKMNAIEKGPRQNGVLEGMTFADNYKTLFVSAEEPLYEDGPRADLTDNNAFVRFYKFDAATKINLAQYAYKLDPVATAANPTNAFKVNGIPDILSMGNNKLLVLERSFSTGTAACTIKIFIADLNNATDISSTTLQGNSNFIPAAKKILFNMNSLGIYIDNVEGMTFGPLLPNGHKTLLFIADNNFSPVEKAQLFLFEIME